MNGELKKNLIVIIKSIIGHVYWIEFANKNDGDDLFGRRLKRQVSMHTLIGTNNLRLNGKLCDASLILENGDEFPIHRSVLSSSSDYFRLVHYCSFLKNRNNLKTVH